MALYLGNHALLKRWITGLIKALEQRTPVHVVYLDFRKVFDYVLHTNHPIELYTSLWYTCIICYACDYLAERKQQIVVNGGLHIQMESHKVQC